MSDMTWVLLAAAISLLTYGFMRLMEVYQYWKKRGVRFLRPLPFFGSILPVLMMKKAMIDIYTEAYKKFPNEKFVGVYEMFKPVLVVRDPELIEKILVKDFHHFVDRMRFADEYGLFNDSLFQLKGTKWRTVRYKVSPTFSSGKLKGMFSSMMNCTDEMMQRIENNLNNDYEIRNALSIFTINVIANTVFGVQLSNKSEKDRFFKLSTSIFNTTPFRFYHFITIVQFPKLAKRLGLKFMSDEATNYFKGLIKNTLQQRESSNQHYNDYTQQLLKLKQQGVLEVQNKDEDDAYLNLDGAAPSENVEISDDLLAGLAFQFISAGFDPLLGSSLYAMYELARNPEIQQHARDHVNEVLAKHKGYTYVCIKDMTYLDQCLQETLRMYPLAPFLFRECTKKYYIPGEKLEVYKGQTIIMPLKGLHMDPKYFPDPEVFNPERFPPNCSRQNFVYLPFGDGPRICIGIRYAMIVMKIGLAKILENYKFTLSPKTKIPFEINKQALILVPKDKLYFNITRL